MKKNIFNVSLICLIIGAMFIVATPTWASTTTAKKVPAKTVVKPISVTWAASGLKAIARIPKGVKPAYKKKVENYAKRNHIKVITGKVVTSMRE
jgi:hypothetical protein